MIEKRERHKLALAKFVAALEVLPYNEFAASCYGAIRAFLEKSGKPIGAMDLLISAHAKSLNCTLVTNNPKEFPRIPGLLIENWV